MLGTDETALVCDLAEVYHVLDYRALPVRTLAMLAAGLEEDSRIVRAMVGRPVKLTHLLMANAVDKLSMLWWAKTEDGQKNRNRPELLTELLLKKQEEHEEFRGYDTAEELMAIRQRIMEG